MCFTESHEETFRIEATTIQKKKRVVWDYFVLLSVSPPTGYGHKAIR